MKKLLFILLTCLCFSALADINMGVVERVKTVTSNYTVSSSDANIMVDATSGNVTVTLPSASAKKGRVVLVYRTDNSSNLVTVNSLTLYSVGESVKFISNGTTWVPTNITSGSNIVKLRVRKGADQSIPGTNTPTVITNWSTPVYDSMSAFNPTTGIYTVPDNGFYGGFFDGSYTTGATPTAGSEVDISSSSQGKMCEQEQISVTANGTYKASCHFRNVYLTKGATIYLRVSSQSQAITLRAYTGYFGIFKESIR